MKINFSTYIDFHEMKPQNAVRTIFYENQANETLSNALSLWAGFPGEEVDVAKSIDIKQQYHFFYIYYNTVSS